MKDKIAGKPAAAPVKYKPKPSVDPNAEERKKKIEALRVSHVVGAWMTLLSSPILFKGVIILLDPFVTFMK